MGILWPSTISVEYRAAHDWCVDDTNATTFCQCCGIKVEDAKRPCVHWRDVATGELAFPVDDGADLLSITRDIARGA